MGQPANDPKTGENVAGSVKLADDRSVGTFTSTPNGPDTPNASSRLVPDGSGTPGTLVADPVAVGTVNATSVSLYGCGSNDLQSMFSFTNFLGMDSGESGGTTIAGMDLAAFAEVSTVATGGSQSQAIDNADQALWDDGFQEDADDEVVYTPAENPN